MANSWRVEAIIEGRASIGASLYHRISTRIMLALNDVILHEITKLDFNRNGSLLKSLISSKWKTWRYDEKEISEILDGIPDPVDLVSFVSFVVPLVKSRMILIENGTLKESLSEGHLQVLENLFPCRLFVTILHGGFAGSLVLQVRSNCWFYTPSLVDTFYTESGIYMRTRSKGWALFWIA